MLCLMYLILKRWRTSLCSTVGVIIMHTNTNSKKKEKLDELYYADCNDCFKDYKE